MSTSEQPDAGIPTTMRDLLAPDQVTARSASAAVPGAVALFGYLGESELEYSVRLYENVAVARWLEIPKSAVLSRVSESGDDDLTKGRSMVFVDPDAVLIYCQVNTAASYGILPTEDSTSIPWPPGPGW